MNQSKSNPNEDQPRKSGGATELFPNYKSDPETFHQAREEIEAEELARAPRDKNGKISPMPETIQRPHGFEYLI